MCRCCGSGICFQFSFPASVCVCLRHFERLFLFLFLFFFFFPWAERNVLTWTFNRIGVELCLLSKLKVPHIK